MRNNSEEDEELSTYLVPYSDRDRDDSGCHPDTCIHRYICPVVAVEHDYGAAISDLVDSIGYSIRDLETNTDNIVKEMNAYFKAEKSKNPHPYAPPIRRKRFQ